MKQLFRLSIHSTDSTQKILRRWTKKQDVSVSAKFQSKGIGQGGNSWESVEGGLYYSIKLHDVVPIHTDSITIAKMVQKEIEKISKIETTITPPNDIYWNGRKLAGVLIESQESPSASKTDFSIIGIGININQTYFSAGLNAISVRQITGEIGSVHTFRAALDSRFWNAFSSNEQ